MKIKTFIVLLMSILIIAGYSSKSAEQHGNGISIEIADSQTIKHLTFLKYVDGREVFSENVINADNSAFEKGEVVWWDVSPATANATTVEVAISYSENLNATNSKTTEKVDISDAKQWATMKFENGQLKLVDYK